MAETQCILVSRFCEDGFLKFKPSIRIEKNGDLSDFEQCMVVAASQAGLYVKESADLLGLSRSTVSHVYREWFEKEKVSSEWQFWTKMH